MPKRAWQSHFALSQIWLIRYSLPVTETKLTFTRFLLPCHGSLMPMFDIVLYQPEIPPNTGNIIRLCANTAARLHLIGPCGFNLEDAQLRRAGLDYHDMAQVHIYESWLDYRSQHASKRIWAYSTKGCKRYDQAGFQAGDSLLFGPESRGLPQEILELAGAARVLRLPMQANSRSLNLSNTVAVALYEALRQTDFAGLDEGKS